VSLKHLLEVRQAARAVTSLDKPVGDDNGASIGDLIGVAEGGVEEEVEISLTEDTLHRALDNLPERERTVLSLRYGLDLEEPQSLRRSAGASASPGSASARSRRRRSSGSRSHARSKRSDRCLNGRTAERS
jgi:RNA polymerase primary sigma factor